MDKRVRILLLVKVPKITMFTQYDTNLKALIVLTIYSNRISFRLSKDKKFQAMIMVASNFYK